eukprot:CAMPEP_0175999384 /NCGR_PEP_ID=MMETSP0108-20121206/57259_1 /TAXON_ID=195067 ORGANISM="Goniomonas pacifica, Strain CCMP1869" /NCGR_SAMPLE_ID=MMETSP0108 /ASSEMBLY_ACC=CAM_ASM_000204 /LENGTH=113 /DNA_ID=CAMNT_0017331815 /DNA_START=33 /DNA_END=374 /DNA_ORIENTATION=-
MKAARFFSPASSSFLKPAATGADNATASEQLQRLGQRPVHAHAGNSAECIEHTGEHHAKGDEFLNAPLVDFLACFPHIVHGEADKGRAESEGDSDMDEAKDLDDPHTLNDQGN